MSDDIKIKLKRIDQEVVEITEEEFLALNINVKSRNGVKIEITEDELLEIRKSQYSDEEKINALKSSKISKRVLYLERNDWQMNRYSEQKMLFPDRDIIFPYDILVNKEKARSEQDVINACTSLDELNLIDDSYLL